MSTYLIYKALISTYKRLDMDCTSLALKIDRAYALGRLADDEYKELIEASSAGVKEER